MLNNQSHLLLHLLEELGTPKALAIAVMLRHDDFSGLSHIVAQPRHYVMCEKYLKDSQALALFTKYEGLKVPGIDPKTAAITSWWESERACYRSNERLSPFLHGSFDVGDEGIAAFLLAVRKKIEFWIGSKPPDLDRLCGRFGPGSTFSDKGRLTTIPDKMSSVTTLTSSAYWYLLPWWQTSWGRSNSRDGKIPSYVRGNRFTTVPKSFKTDRPIAIEPAINVFFQLGIGKAIKNRLRFGPAKWNMSRAQEIHRRVARESSRSQEFATLDLSSASDTVSYNLVKLLMPPAWFEELNALRSPFTFIGGKWVRLEKFSSMGNGFTFELETLIFASLASVLMEQSGHHGVLGLDLYVYGDDIIVPTDVSKTLVAILNFTGFTLNQTKSFTTGPFRESCGGDYWFGSDVRPWFRKYPVVQSLDLIPEVNGLWQLEKRLSRFDASISKSRELWLKEIPLPFRNFRGPEDLGDIIIHDDFERWSFKVKNSIRTFRVVKVVSRHLPWHHWKPDIVLASALYGCGDGLLGVLPRDPSASFHKGWVSFS